MGFLKSIFALCLSLLGIMFIGFALWTMFASLVPFGPIGMLVVGFIILIVAGILGAKTVLK